MEGFCSFLSHGSLSLRTLGKNLGKAKMKEVCLFLEYKFRDFADGELAQPSPTAVMANFERLNSERVDQIRRLGCTFGISLTSLPGNICPASKDAKDYLISKIKKTIQLSPDIIWLDHLRFEGHWEMVQRKLSGSHKDCRFCKGKDRADVVYGLAAMVKKIVPKNIELGYFAVPLKQLNQTFGQDHKRLGRIFDYVSPMLYHRMIGKPATYIGEYIGHLGSFNSKARILPIIQLKDMPDDLEDKLTISEVQQAVNQSLTDPSIGVAVFSWDQVIEKNKLESVSKILNEIK